MKNILVCAFVLSALVCGCDKGSSGGPAGSTSAAATGGDVDCEKVVEKIASLNPADMRGEPEKKLWRSMCAEMKPAERTCVMAAKAMDEMQKCMKK